MIKLKDILLEDLPTKYIELFSTVEINDTNLDRQFSNHHGLEDGSGSPSPAAGVELQTMDTADDTQAGYEAIGGFDETEEEEDIISTAGLPTENKMIKLKDMIKEGRLTREEIQDIVNDSYPKISSHYGRGKRGIPEVTIHSNIYARVSGIEGSEGEANPHGQYDWDLNKIYLYLPRMINKEQVIRSLVHEYTHSLQDYRKQEEYRKLGYAKDPHEIEAIEQEEDWKKFI